MSAKCAGEPIEKHDAIALEDRSTFGRQIARLAGEGAIAGTRARAPDMVEKGES
jgi:hypothetical protein